jgi:hypothetical protein
MLTAVYDLAVSPPTYDFVGFLISAEKRRIELGLAAVEFVIMDGPQDGFRADQLPPFGHETRVLFRQNVIEAMCWLLPTCKSVRVLPRQKVSANAIFPDGWSVTTPVNHYGTHRIIDCARAGIVPLVAPAGGPSRRDKTVSLTLRESSYWPSRNSNRSAWLSAAQILSARGWDVRIVPDIESVDIPDDPWIVDHASAKNLTIRAQLYEMCEINLFINNGPAWMALFMKNVRSTIVRMESEGAPCVSAEFFAANNLRPGSQIGRPGHHIAWAKEETPEIIVACAERNQQMLAA